VVFNGLLSQPKGNENVNMCLQLSFIPRSLNMLTKIVLSNPLILIRFLKTKMPIIILTSSDILSFNSYSMQVLMQIELNSMAIPPLK
jgi:hypothetical protein